MKQKLPFILALLTMVCGVFISILFGANESMFKDKISKDLRANENISTMLDLDKKEAKIEAETSKTWRYYQRFHFHATGIGSMSLSALILLAFSIAPSALKLTSSYMISVGGFMYPFVWLFSALYGPILGRSEAKETFAIFGYMGGIFLLGLIIAVFILIRYPIRFLNDSKK